MKILYKITLSIGYSNAVRDIKITPDDLSYSDEEWLQMSDDEQDEALRIFAEEKVWDYLEISIKDITEF
jgi:hypothetical protein